MEAAAPRSGRVLVRDTHPDAEREQLRLFRAAGVAGRIAALLDLSDEAVAMSRRALRRARPAASEHEIGLALVALQYGPEIALGLSRRLERGPVRRRA
jgi:hypothetical protein